MPPHRFVRGIISIQVLQLGNECCDKGFEFYNFLTVIECNIESAVWKILHSN